MKGKRLFEHWQIITVLLVCYDIVAVNFAYFFGLLLRFDFTFSEIPKIYFSAFLEFAPVYTIFSVFVFWSLRLYKSIWRFASYHELTSVLVSSVITTIFQVIGITVFVLRMPISYYMIGAMMQFMLIVAIRFAYRFILLIAGKKDAEHVNMPVHRAMIIGAGEAGQLIIRELNGKNDAGAKAYCIIDDNSNKWGRYIEGVPVVGGRDSILVNVEKYKIDQILFAIPSATAEEKRDVLNVCKETDCELKSLPGVYQLVNGEASISKMRRVDVEDLLGREPIQVNMDEIFHYIKGKTILVTGGGGSIGSELCRQIAGHEPKRLILFEIYENSAYDIQQELKYKYPNLDLIVRIGSVRDTGRINGIFRQYRPDIVYHAAAHKHVPLMEESPCEAIKNNVMGTYKTAYAAMKNGCKRFVLISTDKAVNPTNVMGASKRICEMVIQCMNIISKTGREDLLPFLRKHVDEALESGRIGDPVGRPPFCEAESVSQENKSTDRTEFVAVRFGNVLGSNGSVIPLFKKQIEKGGPVTVTHPDIIRYFMTIPEAVQLVLQAGTYAHGGEIFVLDMGAPVKIDTLARNLIRLSGYKPDKDIKIAYTGLRPGEKLYEEKLMAEEGLQTTPNKLIHVAKPIEFDVEEFFRQLEILAAHCYSDSTEIFDTITKMVPTYHSAEDNLRTGERKFKELSKQADKAETAADVEGMAEVAATKAATA